MLNIPRLILNILNISHLSLDFLNIPRLILNTPLLITNIPARPLWTCLCLCLCLVCLSQLECSVSSYNCAGDNALVRNLSGNSALAMCLCHRDNAHLLALSRDNALGNVVHKSTQWGTGRPAGM